MQALIIKRAQNYTDAIKLPISKKKFFNGILENTYTNMIIPQQKTFAV